MRLINNDCEKIIIMNTFIFISFINIIFLSKKYKIEKNDL